MSDITPTGPLNPYGDLSRRARRALEAQGIDPEAALAQFNETGDISVLTGSLPIITPVATESSVAENADEAIENSVDQASDEPTGELADKSDADPVDAPAAQPHDLFPATLSRRDENLLEQRATAEIEVVELETVVSEDVADGVADIDTLVAAVDQGDDEIIDVVSEAPEVTSQDIAPVPFDGGPLADVEDVIAIDRSDDAESTISEYEAFQITTTSTGVIPTTGHTLVLPTLPEEDPNVIAALNSTGEIVITGQITLPVSVPASTDSLALDGNDLDGVVEPELVTSSQDLAPVSATTAVSSVAGPTGVVNPIKRRSEKLPAILAISAAILAAGVVALFVANLFIPVFK